MVKGCLSQARLSDSTWTQDCNPWGILREQLNDCLKFEVAAMKYLRCWWQH
jgi:hypothetical protein